MNAESVTPLERSGSSSKKLFFVGGFHSRNSSSNSLVGSRDEAEACVELLPGVQSSESKLGKEADSYCKESEPGTGRRRCEVTGSCMCKLSVVFYLAACILISALYVAFYGKNQAIFGDAYGDAWIPGKVRPVPLGDLKVE